MLVFFSLRAEIQYILQIPPIIIDLFINYLLNAQQYKVRIKGKVDQSWERSSALPYTSV